MIKEIYTKSTGKQGIGMLNQNNLKLKVENKYTFIVNSPDLQKDLEIEIIAESEGEAVRIFTGEYEDKLLERVRGYNYLIK